MHTDGLFSYSGLPALGYDHRPRKVASVADDDQLLPRVHRAISTSRRGCTAPTAACHPSICRSISMSTSFHNRRRTPMAGFQTLLGLGLTHDPVTYRQIIDRAA